MEDTQLETTQPKLTDAEPFAKSTTDTVEQLSIKDPGASVPKTDDVRVPEDMDIDVELDDSGADIKKAAGTKSKSNGNSKKARGGKANPAPRVQKQAKPRGKKAAAKKIEEANDAEEGESIAGEEGVVSEGGKKEGEEEEDVKAAPKKRAPAKRKPAVAKTPPAKKEPPAKRTRKKAQPAETLPEPEENADGNVDEIVPKPKKKRAPAKRKGTAVDIGKEAAKGLQYNPEYVHELENSNTRQNPYWHHYASPPGEPCDMISEINESNPLHLMNVDIRDEGAITGMSLSPDGTMLVTFCNLGAARIWDVESFELLRILRDEKETQIDEMYVGKFTPDCSKIAIGGKLKDRHNWSEADDDNHILNCPLKIFDTVTGEVISRLEGHAEEIICVKLVRFKNENYYITTSQDGHIIKWHMQSDYTTLIEQTKMDDGLTCMAFTVSFAPGTGNKYFLAACDEHLRLYDFEHAKLLQTFENIYSQYCDCGKFVHCVDLPSNYRRASDDEDDKKPVEFAYFVSRGVEEYLDLDDIASRPNTCTLHKLIYPIENGGEFKLEEVRRYHDKDYVSNSWLIKVSSNGRYLMAPGMNGQVVAFNLETGAVTAVLREHEDLEVRDVLFHPTKNLMFTSADDGCVKVYTQIPVYALIAPESEMNVAKGEADRLVKEDSVLDVV